MICKEMHVEMKIGIVTPYDADNMGAMLQSTSLKDYLIKQGHEPYFIRYRDTKAVILNFKKNSCETDNSFFIKYWPRFLIHPIKMLRVFDIICC